MNKLVKSEKIIFLIKKNYYLMRFINIIEIINENYKGKDICTLIEEISLKLL